MCVVGLCVFAFITTAHGRNLKGTKAQRHKGAETHESDPRMQKKETPKSKKKAETKKKSEQAIEWRNRKIKTLRVRVSELEHHPHNPKIHPDKQKEILTASLQEIGVVDDLKAYYSERNGGKLTLWDGHARSSLDPNVEWDVDIYDLTDNEADILVASFDQIGWQARLEKEKVETLLQSIQTDSAALQSFLEQQASNVGVDILRPARVEGGGGDAFDPEDCDVDEANPITQTGDLYLIESSDGRVHKLLCGDSTSAADVSRLMGDERAILFATDPPYLVDYDGTNHPQAWNDKESTSGKDWSDKYKDWDNAKQLDTGLYEGFIEVAINHAIVKNAAWYCWHASQRHAYVVSVWEKFGAFVHQQIIWFKSNSILTRCWYMWQHEPCLFGWVKGEKPPRPVNRHDTTVWQIPRSEVECTDHPTSKPVALFAIPMFHHTQPNELCYEPFAGSGTQLIAAHRTGRRCYAIEREPHFCDVIVKRCEAEGMKVTKT